MCSAVQLPTVPFGQYRLTRLISGSNPLCGGSHWSARRSSEMADYHVNHPEHVVSYLHYLVDSGINTIQARGDYHRVLHWIELFRRDGGEIQWITQTATEMHDVYQNIRIIAQAEPIAIYFHGTMTDNLWHAGKIDKVKDYLSCIRDQGVMVGLGSHIPEVFEYSVDRDWDLDFYMTCFYNISRAPRQSELVRPLDPDEADDTHPTVYEEYRPEDPVRMCSFIQSTPKPCLAFKILAAGRHCRTQDDVRNAFRFAFENIKPTDAVVVGMWQKYEDQIAMNVEHALATIGSTSTI